MTYHPYPRMLYRGDEHLVVQDELGEAEARKQGWGNPLDEAPVPEAESAPKKRGKKVEA